MPDSELLALIHAEIDGELDLQQRADLARRLLADPEARALREELSQLGKTLDATQHVEPPPELQAKVLGALPLSVASHRRFAWQRERWRYAALVAGVLAAASVVYVSVKNPGPGSAEVAGTLAATRAAAALDTVALASGPVTGRASLYRDGDGLAVSLELVANEPVDVLIASEGQALRVNGLGGAGPTAPGATVALPKSRSAGIRKVDLTFLMSDREVGRATLTAPGDR